MDSQLCDYPQSVETRSGSSERPWNLGSDHVSELSVESVKRPLGAEPCSCGDIRYFRTSHEVLIHSAKVARSESGLTFEEHTPLDPEDFADPARGTPILNHSWRGESAPPRSE